MIDEVRTATFHLSHEFRKSERWWHRGYKMDVVFRASNCVDKRAEISGFGDNHVVQ